MAWLTCPNHAQIQNTRTNSEVWTTIQDIGPTYITLTRHRRHLHRASSMAAAGARLARASSRLPSLLLRTRSRAPSPDFALAAPSPGHVYRRVSFFFFFFDTVFSARSQHFFDFDRELWKWGVFFWFVGCRRGWGVWRRWCLSTPPLPLPGSFRFSLLSRRAGVWFRKVSASSLRFDYLLLFAAQSKVAGLCECDKIAWLCAAMPG